VKTKSNKTKYERVTRRRMCERSKENFASRHLAEPRLSFLVGPGDCDFTIHVDRSCYASRTGYMYTDNPSWLH